MARSLKSYTEGAERDRAIRRRIKEAAGGIGTCAALDAMAHIRSSKHPSAPEAPVEAPSSAVEPALPAKPEGIIGVGDAGLAKVVEQYMKTEDADG